MDGKRIVMMGLSYGAMAALRASSKSFREKSLGGETFAVIVSVYPWCNQQGGPNYQDHQWNFYDDTTTPLLVLLGADDDEAAPRSCIDKATANAAKGMPSLMGDKPVALRQGNRTVTYRYRKHLDKYLKTSAAWE